MKHKIILFGTDSTFDASPGWWQKLTNDGEYFGFDTGGFEGTNTYLKSLNIKAKFTADSLSHPYGNRYLEFNTGKDYMEFVLKWT